MKTRPSGTTSAWIAVFAASIVPVGLLALRLFSAPSSGGCDPVLREGPPSAAAARRGGAPSAAIPATAGRADPNELGSRERQTDPARDFPSRAKPGRDHLVPPEPEELQVQREILRDAGNPARRVELSRALAEEPLHPLFAEALMALAETDVDAARSVLFALATRAVEHRELLPATLRAVHDLLGAKLLEAADLQQLARTGPRELVPRVAVALEQQGEPGRLRQWIQQQSADLEHEDPLRRASAALQLGVTGSAEARATLERVPADADVGAARAIADAQRMLVRAPDTRELPPLR